MNNGNNNNNKTMKYADRVRILNLRRNLNQLDNIAKEKDLTIQKARLVFSLVVQLSHQSPVFVVSSQTKIKFQDVTPDITIVYHSLYFCLVKAVFIPTTDILQTRIKYISALQDANIDSVFLRFCNTLKAVALLTYMQLHPLTPRLSWKKESIYIWIYTFSCRICNQNIALLCL